MHKPGTPLRPVVSMVGTAEYGLAKWLDTIIKPHVFYTHVLSSTADFIMKLKNLVISSSDVVCSFDVVSLFTNVPLAETIDLITDSVYSVYSPNKPNFSKDIFKKLLTKATGGMFLHGEKLFRQIDGVAMGGPLGPTFANFFLGHIEKTLFANIDFGPKNYGRYMDDIFAVFHSEEHKQAFFNHLNNQHPKMKFTVEDSISNILPFLDTKFRVTDNGIETEVYRKPTHTNVFMNFKAIAPFSWKFGLILGALHRAFMICSSTDLFNAEVEKLRIMFGKNGYSNHFFNKVMEKFKSLRDLNRNLNVDPHAQPKEEFGYLLKIPFMGHPSTMFKNEIGSLIFKKFQLRIKGVFTSTKVGQFFSLKSPVPKSLKACVVYQFNCLRDATKSYIGKTKRHLLVRSREHLRPKPSEKPTAITDHLVGCVPCRSATVENFSIMRSCQTDYEACIHEALMIRKYNPPLNKKLANSGAGALLRIF